MELIQVGIGILYAMMAGIVYELYALRTRRVPTITELIQSIPWVWRTALIVGSTAGLTAWELFHFRII